jgi:hypothetical protein
MTFTQQFARYLLNLRVSLRCGRAQRQYSLRCHTPHPLASNASTVVAISYLRHLTAPKEGVLTTSGLKMPGKLNGIPIAGGLLV